ncbi:OmpA family protein [Reichenbachiella sp. MALMAid0571]|uniref:OmpA family protein n=1 Tax=Reichenbachiella sp. MALMAid0571 TaxID=3143939 RepID=UPI0032E00DDF
MNLSTFSFTLKLFCLFYAIIVFDCNGQSPQIRRALKKKLKNQLVAKDYKGKERYENGQLKYKGKYYDYPVEVQGIWHLEYVKVGKWIYYHPNGKIERIENYNKPKNCYEGIYRSGKWEYKNEQGITYLEEKYENYTLVSKEEEFYTREGIQRKYIFHQGKTDTLYYQKDTVSTNLIKNPGFEIFRFKPIPIVNKGHSSAEELVADWTSPDNGTPDYYSEIRRVRDVPSHISVGANTKGENSYMGIILYHSPSTQYLTYSEHLQTRLAKQLVKDQVYCIKLDILLSQNSGFYIDQFDALFTEAPIKIEANTFQTTNHHKVEFNKALNNRNKWKRLCASYISDGSEKYLTIGNLQKNKDMNKVSIKPYQKSSLDINESAYYLIDNVELTPVSSRQKCECGDPQIPQVTRKRTVSDFDSLVITNIEEVSIGDQIILNKVQFQFNESKLLESAIIQLQVLKGILEQNPSFKILISGHTDNLGTDEYNLNLSKMRAQVIVDWLVNNGIEINRLSYQGHGSDIPLVENSSDENRAVNRRVEFEITEK